jgi:hypothetical protein
MTAALALLIASMIQEPAADPPAFARELPRVVTGEPVLRFNGKDLDGFYTFLKDSKYEDPKGVFQVRDGLIVVSGEEWGGFGTRDEFADYHLIVEWRWGPRTWPPREKAARDSGILLHGVGEDGAAGGQWLESIECQIIEGGCGDVILVGGAGKPSLTVPSRMGPDGQPYFDPTSPPKTMDAGRFNWWGRDPAWTDAIGFRGGRDVESPAGEWNRIEVFCDGDRITNVVNGVVVNAGSAARPSRGRIMFQSEGAEIHFRRIEVRPIRHDQDAK